MFRKTILLIAVAASAATMASDPAVTDYSYAQCSGSLMPYPAPADGEEFALPDSLRPIFIDHVGRHGARYPASPDFTVGTARALERADSLGTITPLGRELLAIANEVIEASHNRWGDLDSLGMAEQRGIASRMFMSFPSLFDGGKVEAISSYTPRCVMSMYEFTHRLDRLNNHIEIYTSSGRQNSPLMRPFDINTDYLDWRARGRRKAPYDAYLNQFLPREPLERVLGRDYPLTADWQSLALDEYYLIAGLPAMGVVTDPSRFFTPAEYNLLWSCFNLRQYLQRTATTLSTIPAEITAPLLLDIINTLDNAVNGHDGPTVMLRFGHAETLMPLLSQLRLPGCYYMTNYFDTVGKHWCDFYVVPMAANLQFILSRSSAGNLYLTTLLNERPVPLIPGDAHTTVPYPLAREYMESCLPL